MKNRLNLLDVLAEVRDLRALLVDGPFAKLPFDDLVIRELSRSGWAESEIAPIRSQIITFADARRADILGKISPALTAGAGLAVTSGYERTTTATAGPITGAFDAAQAATVLVNGIAATLDRRAATYSLASVNLFPGINRITIEEKDANGVHLRFASLDIWREVAPVAKAAPLLPAPPGRLLVVLINSPATCPSAMASP
jgi:hypothetical protein